MFTCNIMCMDAGRSRFARKELADGMQLEEVVKNVKPTVLLGLSGAAKVSFDLFYRHTGCLRHHHHHYHHHQHHNQPHHQQ